jgi:hypothetical protein
MGYYNEDTDEMGYDVVDEIGAVAKQIQGQAVKQGISLPKSAAIQLATRRVMVAQPAQSRARTQQASGFGSGMATACGLGTANFPAASLAGEPIGWPAASKTCTSAPAL